MVEQPSSDAVSSNAADSSIIQQPRETPLIFLPLLPVLPSSMLDDARICVSPAVLLSTLKPSFHHGHFAPPPIKLVSLSKNDLATRVTAYILVRYTAHDSQSIERIAEAVLTRRRKLPFQSRGIDVKGARSCILNASTFVSPFLRPSPDHPRNGHEEGCLHHPHHARARSHAESSPSLRPTASRSSPTLCHHPLGAQRRFSCPPLALSSPSDSLPHLPPLASHAGPAAACRRRRIALRARANESEPRGR